MKRNRYLYLLTLLICMYPGVGIIAQGVCSSSALAPVYSETFGTSTSSTKKNTIPTGFVTNYTFNGSSPLSDGEYMVTPLGKNTGRNDWAQGRDHTGNTNGNMYIVNAGKPNSGPVDLFFSKQVDNLCPGSVYSFSAWMANMNTISSTKSICGAGLVWPKVTFNIKNTSGTILQSFTTDTLPLTTNTTSDPNWKQYGFQFTLPAGTTSLVLEMRDALGGQASYCGNDLAIDDIIFSACTPTATAVISTASTICSGTSTSINCSLVNSPFSTPAYQWQKSTDAGTTWSNIGTPGTSAMSYVIANAIVADGATYRVLVGPDVSSLSSSTCVTASNTVTLTVNPSPSVTLSSASPICTGNTLSLASTASGGTSPYTYSWTGPNSFTADTANASIANATSAATGTYTITVTDNKNCTASDAKTITVNTTPNAGTITSSSTGGCVGTQIALSNSATGGVWSSSNTAIATVSSSGNVTITGGGTATVSYTVTNANCTAVANISITGANAQLHPDVIECNNGIAHFDATDSYYGVTYSNNNPGNLFAWSVSGGPFNFQGSSTAASQYPGMQFQTGNTYQVILKFTTNGVSCSDTQMVYKNVTSADTIQGSKDTTVCFNSAPIALSGKVSPVTNTYQWSTSGNGVFSNPNALSTTYTPGAADKAAGVIKIYLTGSSTLNATGNCGTASSIDSMTLRIYPDNVGTNSTQVICSNQALNFTPVAAIPGSTFSWISAVSAGTITGNSPSGTGSVIDSLVNLSHTSDAIVVYTITPYAFTPSNVSCSGTPFTFTVTARPKPAVTITNATSSLCTGSNTNLQFSSSLAGSTYSWNSSVISGTATGNSSNTVPSATNTITDQLVASSGSNAIVRYRITAVSPLGCSNTDSTDVLIYGASTTANAGVDQVLCNTTSTLLTANNPLLGNGSWTQAAGPSTAVFGSVSSSSTTLSGLVAGTYRLVWSIGNGSCPAQTDTVVITNAPASVAGTLSANATVCAGNNTGTLTVSGYTGNIIRWESSTDNSSVWNSISNTSNTYTYTNINTTTLFRAVIQSGVCNEVNTAPVTILVNPVSVPGTLSSDATVCASSNSGTLSLAGYTGSIIRWESSVDNGSTWNSISNTTATHDYTNLTVTTLFRAVVESGSCGALASNAVTITVTSATAAGVVSANTTVCAGLNNGTLTLGSYTGTILGWQSSPDNGVTWNTIANTTNQLSYTNLIVSTQYRATVQSGSCPAFASATATITVLQTVTTANAGVDQILCNTTSATLAANTPASGTGVWSFVSGPSAVSFSNANDPSAVLGGLTTGVYQINWTVSNSVCAASQDTVQITVNPQTVPGTLSASATVCATANSGTLSLTGYTGNIVYWQSSTDNGTTWNNISNTSNQQAYTNLAVTTQYRAAVQSGVCSVLYSNIIAITVLQAATTANAGVDQILCNTTSATLAANTPTSGTGAWSFVSGPSAVSFSNANDPSAVLGGLTTGVYQLNWSISNGVCAASQDVVQITINPQTVPGTLSASATVCATANSGTLSLTGYTGNIVYWQSSTDNGTTWNNISNTSNQQAYTNLAVTTQYRAAVQSGVCSVLYSNIITITVLQAVTTANAGVDQSLCNVTSATLNGNTPVSGTGTWSFVSGPSVVSFSNANDPSAVLGGLATGVYQLNWSISNGVCAASQDVVQITINPQTVPGTLSASATVCATTNSGTLSLTGYTGNIVYWQSSTDNGTTWNNISNTSNQQAYTNLAVTTQYRAAVQSGVCSVLYSNIITITVLQAVTTANAGIDQSLCNVTSATLNGNTPVSGTGIWSFISGPSAVSFSNANDPSAVLGGLTAGVYQLNWTVSNGACAASQDGVQITVHPQTVPGTLAASTTVCATANSGTLSLTGYSSSILRWESSIDNGTTWNNITNTSSSHTYNNLTTSTQFRAYVQNAVCPALYSNIATINVLAAATIANAGPDEIIVNGVSSTKLNGNVPVSGTGTWTQVSGPTTVSFSNPNDPRATVGGLSYVAGAPPTDGVYVLRWTISNGVCAVSEDLVQLTVQPPTNPGVIGPDAVVCTSDNHGTLVLSGYLGTILQWESSIDYGATWSVIASTVGTNQNTYDYNNLTTTTLFRALVQNGVGVPLYSGIAATVTVLELVTPANAGADQSVCNNTTSVLAGNTPSSGTGTWSFVSGPSTVSFSNAHDPASVVSGLTTGVYQLAWTISNGICSDSKDYVNITVYDPTVAGTLAAAVTVCATANTGTLSLTGYVSAVVRWEYSTNNGATWNNIASTTDTYTYNNLTATTTYRAYVQNAVCPALYSNTVAINVVQAVTTANAGADQQLCNVGSATLAANTPTSGTGIWSFVSGPAAVSFTNANDPNTTVNGLVAGTYQLAWTISNGLCSPSQDVVQITVYPPTVAGTLAAAVTVCATANTGTLSLTGYVSAVVRWEYSTNNGATWNNIASTTDTYTYNNLTATTAYRAYVQNAVCPALYSNTVAINVVQAVTTANAGADQQLCNVGSATLAANTPTSGTGIWSFVSGPAAVSFTNANDPNTTVNGLVAGTYQLAWTISNGLCSPSQDVVQITVYPPTVAGTLAAAATVCTTANTGTLSLTGYVSAVVRWEYSTNNGATWNNIASTTDTYTYNNLTATTAYRAYVQNAVCPALYSNTVAINVVQAVTTANAGADQQLCNVGSATLAANTPTSGTGIWSFVSGPAAVSFTNANDPNTTVNGLVAGTYQLAWTISNGLCSPSQDVVQITIYAATNSGKLIADAFVCVAGNNGKLSVSGYTGNIIRWESSTDSGSTWNTFNQTSADFSYTNLQVTTQYRVLIQNGICNSTYSNTVTIHVYQLSVGGKLLPTQRTVCVTANTGSLELVGFTGTIQQWESSTDNGNSWSILKYTDTSYTYTSLTSTTWFRVLIKNGECSAAYSDTAKIQVDTATRAGILSGTNIVCSGNSSGMLTLSGRTGNIIHWEYSTDNGVNWNLIVNSTDSLTYRDLTANTLFRVLVKNGACATEYSNSILITVVPLVSIANAGQDQTLCYANSSATLQANEPISGAGKWSQAAGPTKIAFANASSAATMVTGLQIGTYRFVWTISNGICANSTDTVTIKVDKVLSAFSLASINDCGKTTFRFNNTSQSAYGIKKYQWLSSTGDTILQNNATLSFTTDGERKMALAVESNTGCTHTTEAIYKVVVYEFPKANINAIADACKSQLFQVSSDVNSKDSIAFILWNLGNGSRPRDSVVSVQYMSDGNYTLKLTVATVNRCFDSAYKQIAIHPIPVVKIDAKPIICRGEEATLTANGAINYIWTDQDNKLICDGCSITKVRPMQNSSYKVIGYSQYGCSQITTTDVRVIQPLKMIASLNDTICVGQSRQLFAKGAASYSWYPETGLSNKNAASPVAKPLVTTTYQVVGKDNYSCFSDSAQVRITVGNPTRIHIGNDTTVTAGGTYQLNARAEAQDIRKWYWSGPVDFSCKTCPTPLVKVSNDATIFCLAINAYGCTSTDTLNIKTFCPSTDVFIPNAFSPDGDGVNDVLMVQGKGIKMIKSFRIFNRWGEIVFEKTNFLPGDPAYAWDGKIRGKAAPPDVFVYVCEVICEKGIPSIFKGNTAVLK